MKTKTQDDAREREVPLHSRDETAVVRFNIQVLLSDALTRARRVFPCASSRAPPRLVAMSAFGDIAAMSRLLGADPDADPDDTEAPHPFRPTPASLPAGKDDGVAIPAVRPGGDSKAIWDVSELEDDFEDSDEDDVGLLQPEYEFMYKQAVSTADAYLGMAHNKDPGSRSCEDLVFVAHLPGTTALADLDLDVQADRLRLVSQRHKLGVYLPHRVDADRGKAEWDARTEKLKVTLPIVDEDPTRF